jgi:hypothetical protein
MMPHETNADYMNTVAAIAQLVEAKRKVA